MGYNPNSTIIPSGVVPTTPYPVTQMVPASAFGVVADGVTNDTAAILAAQASGYAIQFPIGTCIVDNLQINSGRVAFYASVPGATTFKIATASTNKIMTVTGLTSAVISGIVFNEDGGGVISGNPSGLELISCTGAFVHQCESYQNRGLGVTLSSCTRCIVSDFKLTRATSGAVANAWGLTVRNGTRNIINGVIAQNAGSRAVVLQAEATSDVSNVVSYDGIGGAVFIESCQTCTGTNWRFQRDDLALVSDDALQVVGNTFNCSFSALSAYRPHGFGFILASNTNGVPRYNTIAGVSSYFPGEQHMSFGSNSEATGPEYNILTGLVGVNSGQNAPGGVFPGLDFYGSKFNYVEGTIVCTDTGMRWAIREQDDGVSGATTGGNIFRGRAQAGVDGVLDLIGSSSDLTRIYLDNLTDGLVAKASTSGTYYADINNQHQLYNSAFAADVDIEMNITRAWGGAKVRFTRTGAGAFNLNINQSGLLAAIADQEYADFVFIGSGASGNWILTGRGTV
jgi:hypothetical protein